MRKGLVFCIIFLCLIHVSLFAGGNRERSARNNVYASLGTSVYSDTEAANFTLGAGYEGAIGNNFSLGVYLGMDAGEYLIGGNLLLKPRFYISPALERFFIGGNLGILFYEDASELYDYKDFYEPNIIIDFVAGLNIGYKFVFGSRANGFSMEPSIGYDFSPGRFNMGVSFGFAWGGRSGTQPAAAPAPRGVQDGIYVGIITFGPNAEDITGGAPILLDRAGLAHLTNLIETRYQRETRIGTALFYAAHMGLANMKRAESRLPRNLRKATMITFTDGLDVSSTGLGLAEITDPGSLSSRQFRGEDISPYRDFVSREIRNRRINGTQVEAYIMTILGDDVTDIRSFEDARRSLASEGGQYGGNRNISFSDLNREFINIANDIVRGWVETSFTLITPQLPRGTRIRMTFNSEASAQQAQNAQLFIEGTVVVENNQYFLSNISYGGGLQSSIQAGDRIRGEIKDNEVNYVFPLFSGFNLERSPAELNRLLRQWQMSAGSNAWQINSEYSSRGASNVEIVRHNAVIYLVLDKSSSIDPSNIPLVKQATIAFLHRLYNRYYNLN